MSLLRPKVAGIGKSDQLPRLWSAKMINVAIFALVLTIFLPALISLTAMAIDFLRDSETTWYERVLFISMLLGCYTITTGLLLHIYGKLFFEASI